MDKVAHGMKIVKESETSPISMQNLGLYISQSSIELKVERKCTDSLRFYLEQMCESHVPLLRNANELGRNQYTVELEKISTTLLFKSIENTIYQKFGQTACRIFRILSAKQKIDEKLVNLF